MTYPRLLPAGRAMLWSVMLAALIHGGITADASAQAKSGQVSAVPPNPARASRLTISFQTSDTDGHPLGPTVTPGDRFLVDILLALDASNAPEADVRLVLFDLRATGESLVVDKFQWLLDARAYGFQRTELPIPTAVSLLMASDDRLLRLTDKPVRVARLELTVNGSATLDVGAYDRGTARVRCGFASKSVFAVSEGNMAGGRLQLTVATASPSVRAPTKPPDHADQESSVTANAPSDGKAGTDHAKAKRPPKPSPKRCGSGSAAALLFISLVCVGFRFRSSSAARR